MVVNVTTEEIVSWQALCNKQPCGLTDNYQAPVSSERTNNKRTILKRCGLSITQNDHSKWRTLKPALNEERLKRKFPQQWLEINCKWTPFPSLTQWVQTAKFTHKGEVQQLLRNASGTNKDFQKLNNQISRKTALNQHHNLGVKWLGQAILAKGLDSSINMHLSCRNFFFFMRFQRRAVHA